MKYLVHNYHPKDAKHISLQLDDKWFRMYPGEPIEIDTDSNGRKLDNPDFYAHHILTIYGSIYGIVEVPQRRDRTGIHLDIEMAMEMADAALLQNRHRLINLWAQEQMEGRVRHNLPVLPPSGFVEESIRELNIDVQAKFGFRPLGWDYRPDQSRPIDGIRSTVTANLPNTTSTQSAEVAVLREQLEESNRRQARLEKLIQDALGINDDSSKADIKLETGAPKKK